MSKAVTITGDVDVARKRVTLSGKQDGKRLPVEFVVGNDHTLTWKLRDAKVPTRTVFEGFKAQVRFVGFPPGEPRPLLKRGNTLEAAATGVIDGGAVNPNAFEGLYIYAVELVGPAGGITSLECSWAGAAPNAAPVVTGMGGIKRSGGP